MTSPFKDRKFATEEEWRRELFRQPLVKQLIDAFNLELC